MAFESHICKFCNTEFVKPKGSVLGITYCSRACYIKSHTKYSDADRQNMVADYVSGMSLRQVAIKHGCSQRSVNKELLKLKLSRPQTVPHKHSIAIQNKAIELYKSGLSCAKIENQLGIEKSSIGIWVRRAGIARTTKETSRGNKNCWKGGITKARKLHMGSEEYKSWRLSVFERDLFACQHCGNVGGRLHAHHILKYNKYPEHRVDINNGITLCEKCHCKLHRKHIGNCKVA